MTVIASMGGRTIDAWRDRRPLALFIACAMTACSSNAPPAPAAREAPPSAAVAESPVPSEPVASPTPPSLVEEPIVHAAIEDCSPPGSGAAERVASRVLRRYSSDDYVTEDLFDEVSVRRTGQQLLVRWWAEDRGCAFAAEIIRVDDLVVLRQRIDPEARCAPTGAMLVETRVSLQPSDQRVCLPGLSSASSIEEAERLARPPSRPARRDAANPFGSESTDPWAQ